MDLKINNKKLNLNNVKLKNSKTSRDLNSCNNKPKRNISKIQNKHVIEAKEKNEVKQYTIQKDKTPKGKNNSNNKNKKINFGRVKKINIINQDTKIKRMNESWRNEMMMSMDERLSEDSTNLEAFFDKLKKDFTDVGNTINLTFVVNDKLKLNYSKNEYVVLKVIENEIFENNKLKIKEFIYKDKKLNVFKTLKSNNLEDNSIINVILE